MPSLPRIRLQTGSLYASNEESWFTGTGGPWGFSPWTSQFGGVVGSAGLAAEPFDGTVHNVAAGDEVIFVIAVENTEPGAMAWDVGIRAIIPPGFVLPEDGVNLSVTDGAGTDLVVSGTLFGRDGLSIGAPLSGYDAESGRNIALITYTLLAGPAIPAPNAALASSAKLVHVSATAGGVDVAATRPAAAHTTIVTAAPTPVVIPLTDPAAVSRGQTITFDVALPIPQGTLRDVRIETLLPDGPASLSLVSAAVTAVGAGLALSPPRLAPDGSVVLGTIVNASASGDAATVSVRVVLRAEGTASGTATVQTVVSATDPDRPGSRWATSVGSSVGVLIPPAPPVIRDIWTTQQAITSMPVSPFGGVSFAGDGSGTAQGRTATMAITAQDGALGRFVQPSTGSLDATGRTYVATGTLTQLQAAARSLVFNPEMVGTARFTITLVDAYGGIAQDTTTALAIARPAQVAISADRIAVAPGPSFLTATVGVQQPADSAQGDNRGGKGANVLVGTTGDETFELDVRGSAATWDTIVGFEPGDRLTLLGYGAASSYAWSGRAGAPGLEGLTLQVDVQGKGYPGATVTFAGRESAARGELAFSTSQVGGVAQLTIIAL